MRGAAARLALLAHVVAASTQPHIVLLLADDLGWANIGAHRTRNDTAEHRQGALEAHTPRIDELIAGGIELERHYSFRICSPARCALQTGRNPLRVNSRNTGVLAWNPSDPVSGFAGIPRNMTGIAQKLRGAGYRTAFTGKWDAGMATPQHTPWGRGYEQFYGCFRARGPRARKRARPRAEVGDEAEEPPRPLSLPPLSLRYFQHANGYWDKKGHIESTAEVDLCLNRYWDLFEENSTYRGGVLDAAALDSACGAPAAAAADDPACYEEHLFRRRARAVLAAHDAAAAPLFYAHSFHLAHTPLEVPASYAAAADARLAAAGLAFDDAGRRNYSAMVSYLDEVVGEIVDALGAKGMWDQTFVAFLSDNGGPLYLPGSANNWPLKGGKYADWEGGVRTCAFVAGGVVPAARRGAAYGRVVSIADWYGIFANLAGLAGAQLADDAAAAANAWLTPRGLPTLYPVEAADGLVWDLLAPRDDDGGGGGGGDDGGAQPFHPSLHLSEQALLRWPYKLVVGTQLFANHTGPLYPNCTTLTGARAPWHNDTKVFDAHVDWAADDGVERAHLWAADCGSGCLFDVAADPAERVDLAADPAHATSTLPSMRAELAALNADVFAPDRGGDAPEACARGLALGGYYGPFVDVAAADAYYTGPFREWTPEEQARNALYLGVVDALARPEVEQATIELARRLYPEYFRDPLIASFDHCLTDDTDD